ncbi:four-carbon acid sugar kinase family protein [Ramlibacter lithotrophicus]|uniref:four-carbon acid sugar kinase family protein n=1 Tax=Ramlibacter lithotrophicus TaxID=2606681 RepID=UPI001438D095
MPSSRPLPFLRIVADDLSGAADCAASFADARRPIPVHLHGLPQGPCWALDTDTRAMDETSAVAETRRLFGQLAAGAAPQLVYKKIDSTLRGHVGAELAAALAAAPQFAAALVAPAFPQQGRTLDGGKVVVHGRPGSDLVALLEAAGLKTALLRPAATGELLPSIAAALASGARAIVMDAASDGELALVADALLQPSAPRLLAAGSAGLARALAAQDAREPAVDTPAPGAVMTVVGSFSPASAAQAAQVEQGGDALVLRLTAAQWTGERHAALREDAVAAARAALLQGRHVLFAVAGEVVQPFTRSLVQGIAAATAPLVPQTTACVLTGGDTARAMFDVLGIACLQVTGELEPGISAGLAASQVSRRFILKAGGFGDALALQRVIRRFGANPGARAPS